jgi:small subunit ribosomal protein S14
MAKESIKARQRKREAMVARYAEKRAQLKAEGNYDELQKIPRNASPVRLRNRCKITGKPRGYIRTFGLCRNQFRQMASDGKIPGVTKSSW